MTSNGNDRCPRCTGQLFHESDLVTDDVVCLQCGFRRPNQTSAYGFTIGAPGSHPQPARLGAPTPAARERRSRVAVNR
jgi:hypothetical protein